MDALVEAPQVAEPGQKAQHIVEIGGGRVELDHFLRGHVVELRHVLQVRPVFPAVEHGHADLPGGRDLGRLEAVYDLVQLFIEPGVADDLRPIVDRDGAIGGDQLRDPFDLGRLRGHGEGAYLVVYFLRDGVPEFYAE